MGPILSLAFEPEADVWRPTFQLRPFPLERQLSCSARLVGADHGDGDMNEPGEANAHWFGAQTFEDALAPAVIANEGLMRRQTRLVLVVEYEGRANRRHGIGDVAFGRGHAWPRRAGVRTRRARGECCDADDEGQSG